MERAEGGDPKTGCEPRRSRPFLPQWIFKKELILAPAARVPRFGLTSKPAHDVILGIVRQSVMAKRGDDSPEARSIMEEKWGVRPHCFGDGGRW